MVAQKGGRFRSRTGKPWIKEASNEIELATSSFAWNFNKRLDPISLDWFIYPPLSFATFGL
jgi:hypothetical protein